MATIQNTLHVSEYSADGKLLAFINSDGKLKIWDTETSELRQEFTPKLHLSVPFTCFTWITIDNAIVSKERNKKSKSTTPYIALGAKKGGISLYSFATSKIERELKGAGHQGAITAICRGTSDTLFTSGEDCRIIVWSLSSGTQISSWNVGAEQTTSIVYLTATKRLVVAGRQLKIWSVEKEELQTTLSGHSSNVTLLKYLESGGKEYILSAAKNDRVLNLWPLKNSKKIKNSPIPYLMEDIAHGLSGKFDADGDLKVAAITRSGVLHVYTSGNVSKGDTPTKNIKPRVTIEIATDSSQIVEPIPIISATIEFGNKSKSIHFGYGDRQNVRFEESELDTSEKRQVLIRSDPKRPPIKANDKSINLKTVAPHIDAAGVEYQTTVVHRGKTSEIPMEMRLQNLSLAAGNSAANEKNVAQLLDQALKSKDATLLRTVFINKDEQLIRATLLRLNKQHVLRLVDELILETQKKTVHVQTAVIWLKVLFQTHASQLMSWGTTELITRFGPLLGIIEHRANTLHSLSKLGGRLDLLVNQIKTNTEDDTLATENLLVYEDKDSSDDEGLAQSAGESSDEWDEEESELENGDEQMVVSDADED